MKLAKKKQIEIILNDLQKIKMDIDGEDPRVLYDRFKKETPTHGTMLASEFWTAYRCWVEVKLLKAITLLNAQL